MKETTEKFLNLFYKEGEHVCISHDGYGYHSIPQGDLDKVITLKSPNEKVKDQEIVENEILLASINPVDGYRRDENVTAFRSFLVEMDDGSLKDQMDYIKDIGMPYSICVYSGNKSLHFGIVLDEDIPTIDIWRDIAEWILNIVTKADSQTKNPTRSIRFPGNVRKDGKGKMQEMIDFKGKVRSSQLSSWLNKYEDKNPAKIRLNNMKKRKPVKKVNGIPKWVVDKLENGIDESNGRNNEWFAIAMELAKAGYTGDEMISYTEGYFSPERDFTQREWESIMKYAHQRAMRLL